MEEKTKMQRMVRIGLIVSIVALIISMMLFNFFSCTSNSATYVDMSKADILQLKEIGGGAEGADITGTSTNTESTSTSVTGTDVTNADGTSATTTPITPLDPADFVIDIPDGTQIAVIETSLGIIKVRLYPEFAPKTVENFVRLANEGYYDHTYIYRVQPEIYCAGGAAQPDGNNDTKYNIENERVPSEISSSLWPFRGSLMALDTYTDNNFLDVLFNRVKTFTGSQFLICGSVEFTDEFIAELNKTEFPSVIKKGFIELGGIPNYSQKMCIFGQTYEGFDVLDKILNVTLTDGETLRPEEDIEIISVKIDFFRSRN
jgi:cyclophilin family peptidyl-prolyl cis-trans isomerase